MNQSDRRQGPLTISGHFKPLLIHHASPWLWSEVLWLKPREKQLIVVSLVCGSALGATGLRFQRPFPYPPLPTGQALGCAGLLAEKVLS